MMVGLIVMAFGQDTDTLSVDELLQHMRTDGDNAETRQAINGIADKANDKLNNEQEQSRSDMRRAIQGLSSNEKDDLIIELMEALTAAIVLPEGNQDSWDGKHRVDTDSEIEDRLKNSSRNLREDDMANVFRDLSDKAEAYASSHKNESLAGDDYFLNLIQATKYESHREIVLAKANHTVDGKRRRLNAGMSYVTVGSIAILGISLIVDLIWNKVVNDKFKVGKLTAAALSAIVFTAITHGLGFAVSKSFEPITNLFSKGAKAGVKAATRRRLDNPYAMYRMSRRRDL